MAITKYQYDIATQTANGKVNADQLDYEIAVSIPAVAVSYINVNIEPGKLDVYMADALDPGQQATLTAVVAAHQGFGVVADLKGTVQLSTVPHVCAGDAAWEVLGGIVTTPRFFYPDVTKIIARIIGEHKGDGGQLRLVEEMDGQPDEEKIVPVFDFPDVGATWTRFKVDSNVPPRDGLRNVYRTDCRRNGAASLELRYVTISMIFVKIV